MIQKTLIKNPKSKTDKHSARFVTYIGMERIVKSKILKLIDRGVYKIDYCPYCRSKNTYHKRLMDINGKNKTCISNVWRVEEVNYDDRCLFIKRDYCYDCQQEFMIEFYVWAVIGKQNIFKRIWNKFRRKK